ncbi:MAG: hypothetical protein ACRD5M_12085 [Candidatus Acidiferrales bacterium]
MRYSYRFARSLLLAAALISPAVMAGCAAHASYRVYDPHHQDYHRWDDHEARFYVQWEGETHREHRDFDKRDERDQKEYWDWRHNHSDYDHDKH